MWARIPKQAWILGVLLVWGGIALWANLMRFDAFGIEEPAARALLLNWSVADRVINPVVVFGAPDLRALLYIPLGAYWTGSLVAVKVFSLLIGFAAALLLYKWTRRTSGDEAALLATGLFLISPLLVQQMDTLGTGPYLLLLFALGAWTDARYRAAQRPLGGWFFLHILLMITMVSLHPAGLAYPLALALYWRRNPLDARQKRHIYIAAAAAVIFVLLFRLGWPALEWLRNPLVFLGWALVGHPPGVQSGWGWGIPAAFLLVLLFIKERRTIVDDLLNCALWLALVIGAVAADGAWALIALALLLYRGMPLLIEMNAAWNRAGFFGQRGLVMMALIVAAILFSHGDKAYHAAVVSGSLDGSDEVIRALTAELEGMDEDAKITIVSQWPARTMLATRHTAFPLPPSDQTREQLRHSLARVNYIVFDPYDKKNKSLTRHLSELTDVNETLILLEGGAVLRVRPAMAEAAPTPPAPTSPAPSR